MGKKMNHNLVLLFVPYPSISNSSYILPFVMLIDVFKLYQSIFQLLINFVIFLPTSSAVP